MLANIRGLRAWYDVRGERGTPVLLVMGFGMSGKAWGPQLDELAAEHRVAFYDSRGVGESEAGRPAFHLRELADDAAALLDHLGWDRAHVVGVSMGGMVAQHLALRHRQRVRSLALVATHPGGGVVQTLPTVNGLRLFLRANTSTGPARLEALRHLLFPPGATFDVPLAASGGAIPADAVAIPATRRARVAQLAAIIRHDTRRRLATLQGLPTVVIKPAQDVLVRPRHSDTLHRAIPGSRLVVLEDAGHGVTVQASRRVNRVLLDHFRAADGT